MTRRDITMSFYGRFVTHSAIVTTVAALTCLSSSTHAGTFTWGNLQDPAGDVMYLDVTENNAETAPLFDEDPNVGSPDVVGNSIRFDPQGFQSQSNGGAADLIDSTLTTVIMAKPGKKIDNVFIQEFGDYTLSGLTGGQGQATVGAAFYVTILEVDGNPVSGIPVLTDNLTVTTGSGPNGGEYNRSADDGTAVIWSGSALLDISDHLQDNNVGGAATKVRLRFDNTLSTAADSGSNAFIKKKLINGDPAIVIITNIPEPSAIALTLLAVVGGVATRRRFR